MSENTPNTPTIDLNTDISHLNLGHATLGELHSSETTVRNQLRNPTAPESYDHSKLVETFGEVVTASRDSQEHQAALKHCRDNNFTQGQFEAYMSAFYQQGSDQYQAQQNAIKARDDALSQHFGGDDNAAIVWNRIKAMGIDPNILSAEQIVAQHDNWQKLNPNEQQILPPTAQGNQPNAPAKPANAANIRSLTDPVTGEKHTMDISSLESINAFTAKTFEVGKRKMTMVQKFPQAQALIDEALKAHTQHAYDTAQARKRELGLV